MVCVWYGLGYLGVCYRYFCLLDSYGGGFGVGVVDMNLWFWFKFGVVFEWYCFKFVWWYFVVYLNFGVVCCFLCDNLGCCVVWSDYYGVILGDDDDVEFVIYGYGCFGYCWLGFYWGEFGSWWCLLYLVIDGYDDVMGVCGGCCYWYCVGGFLLGGFCFVYWWFCCILSGCCWFVCCGSLVDCCWFGFCFWWGVYWGWWWLMVVGCLGCYVFGVFIDGLGCVFFGVVRFGCCSGVVVGCF